MKTPSSTKKAAVVSIAFGDHRAKVEARRNRLVEDHMVLVPPIAAQILSKLPPSFELDDLVQQGNLGLLTAATRYRPKEHNDTPFSAFARPRIKGAILDSVRRRHWEENTRPSIDEPSPTPNPLAAFGEPVCREIAADPAAHGGQVAIETRIDRRRIVARISRVVLSDEQAAVVTAYYSVGMPSLAAVAAQLGLPEGRVVRAHTEAVAILKSGLKDVA